jgi:DNA ligase-1
MTKKEYPPLYKMDNAGRIRIWSITAWKNLEGHSPAYEQKHGVKGGKIQTTRTFIEEGKSIGRSNETSPWKQCRLEAKSKWKSQRDRRGYSIEIPTEKPFGPMLANRYQDRKKKIKFPCYIQPKLDGFRCFGTRTKKSVLLISRSFKVYKILKHIEKEVKRLPKNITYDGELYKHHKEFQKISGAIKRDTANELTAKVEFWIYDFVNETKSFTKRNKILQKLFRKNKFKFLKYVPTIKVNSHKEIKEAHKHWTNLGFEGVMIRNSAGGYAISSRSDNLLKFKEFRDAEFEITGARENRGKLKGTCVFLLQTKKGAPFKAMPEGTFQQRSKMWKDWQKGKIKPGALLTVKFFRYTTTKPKVPYLPIGLRIRDDL